MITFRVHGYWLGPLTTVWSTITEEEFEKYCKEWKFVKDDKGVYREGKSYLEIKSKEEVT
jgi:hypothetical protein